MSTFRVCSGLNGIHDPLALPEMFFTSSQSPHCKICDESAVKQQASELDVYLEQQGKAIKLGHHDLAAHGYHPSRKLPIGYRAVEVPLEVGSTGIKRQGNRPHYGIKVVRDEAVSDRVEVAWNMRLSGAAFPEIHRETHLYRPAKSKNPYGTYYQFFDNRLYAGIFILKDIWYPLDWQSGNRFCDPYISLEEYERVPHFFWKQRKEHIGD